TVKVGKGSESDVLSTLKDGSRKTAFAFPYQFLSEQAQEIYYPYEEGILYYTHEVDPVQDTLRWRQEHLTRALSMPWWGVGDGKNGVMTLIETPYDVDTVMCRFNTPKGFRALPFQKWLPEKGKVGYERKVTYHFVKEGGYNTMAKYFRENEKKEGRFKSWKEKIKDNPEVQKLLGAPNIWIRWSTPKHMIGLINLLASEGIKAGLVACDGPTDGLKDANWRMEKSLLDTIKKHGWLYGKYHLAGWIRNFYFDTWPDMVNRCVTQENGKKYFHKDNWHKDKENPGHYYTCPKTFNKHIMPFARPELKNGAGYFFIDTSCTAETLQWECWDGDHPYERKDAPEYINRGCREMNDLGLVIGSERGKWCHTTDVHVFEGMESFLQYVYPFYGSGNKGHWVGPYMKDAPGFKDAYVGFEINQARRLPLFQLVYHDSVYCTRRWNCSPERWKEKWDYYDLQCIIYGISQLYYFESGKHLANLPGQPNWDPKNIESMKKIHNWHKQVGFSEMLSHKILTSDRLVQESRFANGKGVIANFSDKSWKSPNSRRVEPMNYITFSF
ncbi:MAG: hypothetical protein HQL32_10840, partial [Planctomycetes bacterium]|nr:hypothetical protein [Planctomycetota bacterium]